MIRNIILQYTNLQCDYVRKILFWAQIQTFNVPRYRKGNLCFACSGSVRNKLSFLCRLLLLNCDPGPHISTDCDPNETRKKKHFSWSFTGNKVSANRYLQQSIKKGGAAERQPAAGHHTPHATTTPSHIFADLLGVTEQQWPEPNRPRRRLQHLSSSDCLQLCRPPPTRSLFPGLHHVLLRRCRWRPLPPPMFLARTRWR